MELRGQIADHHVSRSSGSTRHLGSKQRDEYRLEFSAAQQRRHHPAAVKLLRMATAVKLVS